ncbi:hypothetical protein BC940DRAFT_347281 [Gongronella butleri]|nr:hypothetical protein BC940DRAFT_347281 [Gongronella butleri]
MDLYDKLVDLLANHTIDEIGLLPCVPDATDIPPATRHYHPLVVVDGKLGVALDTLTALLQQSQQRFTEASSSDEAQQEETSRVLILLKPDHYTAMNVRKRLVCDKKRTIAQELALLDLIFTVSRHTKSAIAWHHREWLLTRDLAQLDIEAERRLCERSATLYPRNYYAWHHRFWLLEQMNAAAIEEEYESMVAWAGAHVSDHSGIHHLGQVVERWLVPAPSKRLAAHVAWLDNVTQQFPGHESLWAHRRACAMLMLERTDETTWPQSQHRWIDNVLHYKPKHADLDTSPASWHQQHVLALRYGLWLCLLRAKVMKNEPVSLIRHYLDQLRLVDPRPIYNALLLDNTRIGRDVA